MTVPTQVWIDADVKSEAAELFASLGLDMSEAINIFLHQCILRGGLPFPVEVPVYNRETRDAMEEVKRIADDASVPGYNSMEELRKALDE